MSEPEGDAASGSPLLNNRPLLGLLSKLYQYILSGELRSLKLGRRRKIPAEALPEFIAKLQA